VEDGRQEAVGVVIADDHPIFREGLAHEIRSRQSFQLLGEAADGRQALRLVRELHPHVVVLDLRMPGIAGALVIEAVAQLGARTRSLVLSAFDDRAGIFDAIAAGASGYVLKDADRDVICHAIERVARGEMVLPPGLQHRLLQEVRTRNARQAWQLTKREREILELVAQGHSTPEIGRRLYIEPSTVKTHLERVADKLGVRGRTATVAEALRRGLVD
jgi:two-component system nitrate/nitrite response regulator NarL